jgi:hypothetical protein
MANSKISGLTAATTPLAGTEELALLQTSDRRITVADFAAGAIKSNATTGVLQVVGPVAASTRVMTTPDANFSVARTDAAQTLTGNQTITNGNVVVSSGYGIDFSATPGTGTSELLADYEEGTWTPSLGGDATYTTAVGNYLKVGSLVYVSAHIHVNVIGTGNKITFSGLPFTSKAIDSEGSGGILYFTNLATNVTSLFVEINSNATTGKFGYCTTAQASITQTSIFKDSSRIFFNATYISA